MSVLQRPFWNGDPEELRELFALVKRDGAAQARCALWSHQFGWELRLTVNGSLIRSQVSRVYASTPPTSGSRPCARKAGSSKPATVGDDRLAERGVAGMRSRAASGPRHRRRAPVAAWPLARQWHP